MNEDGLPPWATMSLRVMRERWHAVEVLRFNSDTRRMMVSVQRDDEHSPWRQRTVFLRRGVPWHYGYDEEGRATGEFRVTELLNTGSDENPTHAPMRHTSRRRLRASLARRANDHVEVRPLTVQTLLTERTEITEALRAIDFDFVRHPNRTTLEHITNLRDRLTEIDDLLIETIEQNTTTQEQQDFLTKLAAMTPK